MSELTYYVLSKAGEPDQFLAVICKQTKDIFCCSCHAWHRDPSAFKKHKRYCDGFEAWHVAEEASPDNFKALKLLYSQFACKAKTDRSSRLQTGGLMWADFGPEETAVLT